MFHRASDPARAVIVTTVAARNASRGGIVQESSPSVVIRVGRRFVTTQHGCLPIGASLVALLLSVALLVVPVPTRGQPAQGAPSGPTFSEPQLDQMLAPIALYPDEVLGQILIAATYPLEVVQANRWLTNPANASLRGADLAAALQQQSWDPSIKSLVPFPQILSMMDLDLDWTETLGDAFLAQQGDVMDAVQQLRARAQAAGTLASTPQQSVTNNDQAVEIAPPDANTVYVPVYDPDMAYGDWPYPQYPPYDLVFPGYPLGAFVGFSIFAPFWGWDSWDWHHHRLNIVPGGPGPRFPLHPGPWLHDPGHRGGVPYRDAAVRARFEGTVDGRPARSEFRGYGSTTVEQRLPSFQGAQPPAPVRAPAPAVARPATPRYTPNVVQQRSAPAYESYGRGPQVHVQEQRGASSRMSAPAGGGRVHR